MIEQSDVMITEMLGGMVLPMTSDLQQIGGVATYVVTPDGVPTDEDGPVFLSIHGGGLIMGGGDLTRVMTEISALSATRRALGTGLSDAADASLPCRVG